jgi:hypothetical protein
MKGTAEARDPLPEEFGSEEAAAEFWDIHSLADYAEYLEPAKVEARIEERHFEIEVDESTFRALTSQAKKSRRSVKELASQLLTEGLCTA